MLINSTLTKNGVDSNVKSTIKSNEIFISDLNDYCIDHIKHHDCLPTCFEYNGHLIDFDDFIPLVRDEVSDLINI